MKKISLRRAIFGNIMIIAIASVMLVATTFAWFTLTDSTNVSQELIIGKFNISLDDEAAEYTAAYNINVSDVLPMTRDSAYGTMNGANRAYVYKFSVDNNKGGISAKYRIKATLTDEATDGTTTLSLGGRLAELYSFQERHSTTTEAALTSGTWAPAATGTAPLVYSKLNTIGSYFNGILVSGQDATALGTISSTDTYKVHFYEVFVWLNQDVTLSQIYGLLSGALAGKGDTCTFKVTFTLTLEAMQSAGNAPWSDFGI